ncbi:MAG: asparaginase [Candidatus Cloacimonetes bacterium]|nr:asparaginase [Candidatus Cloacimonadota bacterium]
MEKKKILIITTGGTIAMKFDEEFGVVSNNELVEMLHSFPQLDDVAEIVLHEFTNIPSPYMTPEKMLELAKLIEQKAEFFDGIVITHGTDTLEESSFFLDTVLTTKKPVIMTAAMRSGSELGLDGPRNIVGAVRVATNPKAYNKGVLVVLNDEINAARDVVKSDSGKTDTFITPAYGILGTIDPDKVIFYRDIVFHDQIYTTELDVNVDLIKCVSGLDGRFINASIQNNCKAIVIEAFGRGNIPRTMIPALKEALAKDIIIVVVSSSHTGRVLAEYGYEGGGLYLEKLGVILGGDLKGSKMRLKLMVLLGKYKDPELVKQYLRNHIR